MKVLIYGYPVSNMNGMSRYSEDLFNGLYNYYNYGLLNERERRYGEITIEYKPLSKYEIIYHGRKYGGFVSYSILKQFQLYRNYNIIHSLTAVYSHKKSNVITIHDLVNIDKESRIYSKIKNTLKSMPEVIVPLPSVKKDMKDLFNYDSHVINHGIARLPEREYDNPFHDDKIHIIIMGGLDLARRRNNELVDRLKNTQYEIYIIGYGDTYNFEKYRHYRNIHLLGYLEDEKVYEYMAHADLLMYNSIGEGFGYIPLEAMRFNLNTLINFQSSFYDAYKDKVFYFYGMDNLESEIEYAIEHKKLNLKEWVYENYSIEKMAKETAMVYDIAIKGVS